MKIRSGFVSNSSSASFVVKFTSEHAEDEVQEHLNELYANDWFRKSKIYDKLKSFPDHYEIEASTTMFNDWYDVTEWPFIRMLCEIDPKLSGYTLLNLIQTEEEYDSCEKEVRFDEHPWDYEEGKELSSDSKEKLEENSGEYLNYLYKLKLPIDDKLLLLDYKFSK